MDVIYRLRYGTSVSTLDNNIYEAQYISTNKLKICIPISYGNHLHTLL